MTLAPECSFQWDGAAIAIFLGAIPLAVVMTIATLLLYRRSIGCAMRSGTDEKLPIPEPLPAPPPVHPLAILKVSRERQPAERSLSLDLSTRSKRRLSLVNTLAGVTHASIATLIMFWLNDLELKAIRTLTVWVVFMWPVLMVWLMTLANTRLQQLLLASTYFGLLLLLEIVLETFQLRNQPAFGELFLLWSIIMGTPTTVTLLLANRAWRSLGLITLFISIVLMAAYLLGFQLLGCLVLTTRMHLLLQAMPYLQISILIFCAVLSWFVVRRVASNYQSKRTSDQMLTLDSLWLLVTALEVLFQMTASGLASLFFLSAFAGYKLVLHWGLKYTARQNQSNPQFPMLLLRVFGHTKRTRTLTDQVGQTWRHAGPINMIGGIDLATALLEPDELMAFWSGKLRQGFIASAMDLDKRLNNLDEKPDPDGRYRINEFFCHDNTWQMTVRELARRSKVVLMDLRGFGRQNRGCEFELGLLLNEVPLTKVTLLVDRTTRIEDLQALLQTLWAALPSSSPNHKLTHPALQLFDVEDSGKALKPLLSHLFKAAA